MPRDWPEGSRWVVGVEPAVTIGMVEGDSVYQLYRVRDVRRLSDGRIVVANSGTQQLRFYDVNGRYLSASGGLGDGPGEFRGLDQLNVMPGDTLLAFDVQLRRVSIFDPAGEFLRSFQLPTIANRGFPRPIGAFDDGSLLVYTERGPTPDDANQFVRDPVTFFRVTADGAQVDTIGDFATRAYYVAMSASRPMTSLTLTPFMPTPVRDVHGDRFYFGNPETYEYRTYSPAGQLQRIVRLHRERAAVAATDVERYKEEYLEPMTDDGYRQFVREALDDIPFPETYPAYYRMHLDDAANVWLGVPRPPGDTLPRWTLFDPSGQVLGTVGTPPGLMIDQIGEDFVLGRRSDELDVEHVELYRLRK